MKSAVLLLTISIVLSGCAHRLEPPASAGSGPDRCYLPVVKLAANQYDNPDEGAARLQPYTPDRGATLGNVLEAGVQNKSDGKPKNVLVLSGGSLHGAFGAGLLYGWMTSSSLGDEKLPAYDMITGVSTGALQSTFALLATSTDPYVRDAAQRDKSRLLTLKYLSQRMNKQTLGIDPPGQSYLANLAQFYMPDTEGNLLRVKPLQRLSPNKGGFLELLNNPSLATMAPLRDIINAQLGDQTLEAVSLEAKKGRKLFVAVGNLTNLYGYAADLTRLTELAGNPDTEDQRDVSLVFPGYKKGMRTNLFSAARKCYVDALIASSSVPPGVPAVAISIIREDADGHMYSPYRDSSNTHPAVPTNRVRGEHVFVDGGAAFAVFFSQLKTMSDRSQAVDMDLIVNGSYFPTEWSKQLDAKGNTIRASRVRFSPQDIVARSVEGLSTQNRLLSVQEARRSVYSRGRFRWAFIDNRGITSQEEDVDILTPWKGSFSGAALDWKVKIGDNEKSCSSWKKYDAKKQNPMEFYPSYMRCMLSYGVARGRDPEHRWNLCSANDPRRCGRTPAEERSAELQQRSEAPF